jgi:hypothetical protein
MAEPHKNVFEALNAAMGEMGYVQKQKTAGLQYSYAGEAALIAEVRPALVKHGVVVYPSGIRDLRNESYENKNGTTMNRAVGWFTFTFVHGSTDTSFVVEVLGEGVDAGDKSCNKAMTGAYKYALRQALMIETGDDPDKDAGEHQERAKPAVANKPQQAPKSAPAAMPVANRPYDPETLKKGIAKQVLKAASSKTGNATDKQRGAMVAKLNSYFQDQDDPDEARHRLLHFLFGHPSTQVLTAAQVDALFKWSEDGNAISEARAAAKYALKHGGDSELDNFLNDEAEAA